MVKKEIRKIYRERYDKIDPAEKIKWDDLILIQCQSLKLPFINSILSFYPLFHNNEVDTIPITGYMQFKNPALKICYPKTHIPGLTMNAIFCNADTIFRENAYQIPEPEKGEIIPPGELDLILVPLLAFDDSGNRVGYGKGFYDRYMKSCRPDCIKAGLSYFDAVESIEDANEFDVPLDICITPHRIYVF